MSEPLWRYGATPEEAAEIAKLDERMAAINAERRMIGLRRQLVANRALQRVRYEERKFDNRDISVDDAVRTR